MLVRLTLNNGRDLHVNPDHVVSVAPTRDEHTVVTLAQDYANPLTVRGLAEDVVAALEGNTVAKEVEPKKAPAKAAAKTQDK